MDYCERYSQHFIGQGRNSIGHARDYLSGMMGTQRSKNMETFENDVAGSDYQGMEQFISSSVRRRGITGRCLTMSPRMRATRSETKRRQVCSLMNPAF
jgi:hypothetical protein